MLLLLKKKLNNKEQKEFERALESEATWHLDKEILAAYHMQYEKNNKNAICNKNKELRSNKRLNEALKAKRATSSTVKFTLHYYYNEPLLKLIKNSNLRQIWTSTNNNSNEEFWIKLAQFGLNGAFNSDSTFTELVALISGEINYISGSTLPYSSTSIETLENIYPKINYIFENIAVVIQVRGIVLKIPIEKVPPIMVAMLPMKGNEDVEQIAYLIRQIIELSHLANLNILSIGADSTRSEFNAQLIITNEASNFLEYKDSFYKIHFKAPLYNNKPFI
ncbi:hypothetical protein F8M41_019958 [Gigaspora margarita]|uniref:Uncharacterized protein n=1 Tax=Gigaspora margarita TaxID=4874 RepID=A0A8H4AJ98_GIGMA|nr:hypothetical protein F8M41_019958 [Gigaspora margarita]